MNAIKMLLTALVACLVVTGFVGTAHACGTGWMPDTDIDVGQDETTLICAAYTQSDGTVIYEAFNVGLDHDGNIDIAVDSSSTLDIALWNPFGGDLDTDLYLDDSGGLLAENLLAAVAIEDGVAYYSEPLEAGAHVLTVVNAGGVACGTITVNSVPEPATLVLLGSGLIGVAGLRWRRQKSRKKAAA